MSAATSDQAPEASPALASIDGGELAAITGGCGPGTRCIQTSTSCPGGTLPPLSPIPSDSSGQTRTPGQPGPLPSL